MSNFLMNGAVVSNEWALVIGVGTAFFILQVALCMAVCVRLRRQERAIRRLHRDFEQGGNGRPDVRRSSRSLSWPQWVASHFPAEAHRSLNNFTREDALQELDARIASNGSYLLLQRMGVMAPLLGVVLTVAGFYWLNVDERDQSLQSILTAVTPLMSGVGIGAVLALFNQALLHIAGRRVESLRMTGRNWFDAVVWNSFGCGTPATTLQAVDVMELFVRSAMEDVERLSHSLARAAEISVAIDALPEQIQSILDRKLAVGRTPVSNGANGPIVTRLPRTAR